MLWAYLRPQGGKAALMAVALLAGVSLQLWVPQILRDFIDGAGAGMAPAALRTLALIFLAAALGHQLLAAGATYVGADLGWSATNLLRRDLARHCLQLDMGFHTARTPGEMIERIDGDVTALSNFFSQFSVRVFGGALLLLGILALLWLENPWVGVGLTLFTALEMVVLGLTRSAGVPATTKEREANARLFGFIEERLAGIEDLRANGAGAHAMARFDGVMREFFFGTRRAWLLRSVVWLSSYGLFIIGSAATLAGAIVLVARGSVTLGTAYMVFQYLLMLQTPIDQITQQMQELQKAAASLGRVRELLSRSSALPAPGQATLRGGPLSLTFERVSFGYGADTARRTLDQVSFEIPPGRVLGLLGRTGSGKTSLTRLLLRLYAPDSGRILLGGEDLSAVDPAALRAAVGLVTQDVQLFQASVRDNLTFFASDVSDRRLEALLDELGLGPWLATLERGLDTVLAPGGGNLSAGEAQLLAFARVFLKDPGLVVLDEPSSRLDPASEQRLERAVTRLLQGRTAIIVAHRLETVERADDILVLGEGRVLEHGPRQLLAGDPDSHYSRLLRAGTRATAAARPELAAQRRLGPAEPRELQP